MTRDEMINVMLRAWGMPEDWFHKIDRNNVASGRVHMGRVLDAIEPLIRADERAATGRLPGLPCVACLECGARVEFPNLYYCRNQSCIEKRAPRP